jgi:Na+-translocating ferredoxin:NAD+ oxidoreductase RnfG subunit
MNRRTPVSGRTTRRSALARLAAGAALAAVPGISLGTVYMSAEEAVALMFPGETFKRMEVVLTKPQILEIQRRSGMKVRTPKLDVWRMQQGGAVLIDRVTGKHELITYACGINPDESIKQLEILEYREAYGDAIREARWRAQFIGKRGDALQFGEAIRNVSGATLSCRHVTEGVRRLLASYNVVLK